MPHDLHPLEAAIHSIYKFIRRTAEPAATGTTWETVDYENKPHHHISVFNGVGGIGFFLTAYYQRHGTSDALAMARGAVDWCANYQGKHHKRGLHMGQTGAALAALHVATAAGEPASPFSLANARFIMTESPGPVTDLLGGAASNGFYLLKLHEHTGDNTWLRGAERCAEWLETQMIRDEQGTYCFPSEEMRKKFPDRIFLGAAHGISGVAHFLICLTEKSLNDRWAKLARELLATITRHARPIHGGLNWAPTIALDQLPRCQWSHGAPGIGLTYLAAHRVLGDNAYLEIAKQAAEATYHYGDFRHNYTQCTGLAGGGELLLETHRATGESRWLDRALDFAHQSLRYRENTPAGDAWPTDAPGLYSADFDYGASGLGHFLIRVTAQEPVALPLM
jgi:lantibiotic modifying enzyme